MPRTSPVHYIAPSAISIVPNANGSENDLAVYVARGVRIKVYSPKAGIDTENAAYRDWSLSGRNRRLADSGSPYTIYARLSQLDRSFGYLVFAPKIRVGERWLDKYPYVVISGIATGTAGGDTAGNWYVRLGDVSLPEDGRRTVTLDTGILGTDQFNAEWNLDPDDMPLRVVLSCTVDDVDAGPTPYVLWGQTAVLTAGLVEGWDTEAQGGIDHWTIDRKTENGSPDPSWPDSAREASFGRSGTISLPHIRNGQDDFLEAVSTVFTVTAWGLSEEDGAIVPVAQASITIMPETVETYRLALSEAVVSYNPVTGEYRPADGITVGVRGTSQKGEVFRMTRQQVATARLSVSYCVGGGRWIDLPFSSDGEDELAVAVVPVTVFQMHKGADVRLTNGDGRELDRVPVAFVQGGTDTADREWIFLRSRSSIAFGDARSPHPLPSLVVGGEVSPEGAASGSDTDKDQDGWVPMGWWDEMQGTDEEYRYEYASFRDSSEGDDGRQHWGAFSVPTVWGRYSADYTSYRCRWELDGQEVWMLPRGIDGQFRGRLPLTATLMRHSGGDPEEPAAGEAVITLRFEGDGYEMTQEAPGPRLVVSEGETPGAVPHLSSDGLTGLSVTFAVGGETFMFSIPTTVQVDGDEMKGYYLSKAQDDEAYGTIGFLKGVWFGARDWFVDALGNVALNFLTLRNLKVTGIVEAIKGYFDVLRSNNFSSGLLDGMGWRITTDNVGDGSGGSEMEIDFLKVRKKATFMELEVRKETFVGGNQNYSPAGSIIYRVDYMDADGNAVNWTELNVPFLLKDIAFLGDVYNYAARKMVLHKMQDGEWSQVHHFRCYLLADDGTTATRNWWRAGDQVRSQTFNRALSSKDKQDHTYDAGGQPVEDPATPMPERNPNPSRPVETSYYWRLCTNTGSEKLEDGKVYDYIDLPFEGWYGYTSADIRSFCDAGSGIPVAGDHIVCMGNRNDQDRMNMISLCTTGTDNNPPSIKGYRGIHAFNIMPANKVFEISPDEILFRSNRFKFLIDDGNILPPVIDRGEWGYYQRYHYYDRVSWNGSMWLCLAADDYVWQDAAGNGYADYDVTDVVVGEGEFAYTFDAEPRGNDHYYKTGKAGGKTVYYIRFYTYLEPADGTDLWMKQVAKGTDITDDDIMYAASLDGVNHPDDEDAGGTDPSTVVVPETMKVQTTALLSSFAQALAPTAVPVAGSATHEYLSKLYYEARSQYYDGTSPYGLPLLYRKELFPSLTEYYGTESNTDGAFSALAGVLFAMVLCEIRPDRHNAVWKAGYNLGGDKSLFVYRYNFASDRNIARMVGSVLWAAMRGIIQPDTKAMQRELGGSDLGITIREVSDRPFAEYKDSYYIDLTQFMPTAPGPYLSGYTDRSSIGGVPYDAYDLADHNLQQDLDIYNLVVSDYNLGGPHHQEVVQAIADKEMAMAHLFGKNRSQDGYSFHPVFGLNTIGKEISDSGPTASFVSDIASIGRGLRHPLQLGAYYGRRRPGQSETDGVSKSGAAGVLMNMTIDNIDGSPSGYGREGDYNTHEASSVYANSYPSGHSSSIWAVALMLIEAMPRKAALIMKEANIYAMNRQITRYHWNSDTIHGRVAGATIAPMMRASSDWPTLFAAAKAELVPGGAGAWKPTIEATGIKMGWYLWTRRKTYYSDNREPTVEYSVARWGIDGDGIAEIDSVYLATSNTSLVITASSDSYPMPGDAGWPSAGPQAKWFDTFAAAAQANGGVGQMQGWNVWQKTVVKYDAYDKATGDKVEKPDMVDYQCSRIGKDGQIGMEEYYLLSKYNSFDQAFGGTTYDKVGIRWYKPSAPESEKWRLSDTLPNICTKASEQQSANTPIWSTKMPAYDKAEHGDRIYLWNFEQSVDGDGTEYATKPVCIGNHSRIIKGVIELYALSASQTPVSADRPIPADINAKNTWGKIPTGGFSDPQVWADEKYERAPSEDLPYQWNWSRTLYSSHDPETGLDYEDHYHVSSVKGTAGEDGTGTEYVYKVTDSDTPPSSPANPADRTKDDYVPSGWSDNPHGVSYENQYEWVSERTSSSKPASGGFSSGHEWGDFSAPRLWSKWGQNGRDGDGVEYVFIRTANNTAPSITNSSDTYGGKTYLDDDYLPLSSAGRCTDDPQGTSHDLPYEWVCKRTKASPKAETGVRQWEKYSGTMALWATFSENVHRLDISNEMDMIPTTAALRIDTARTVETTVRIFDGATEVDISSATIGTSGGPSSTIATASQAADGKGRKLSWAFKAGQTMAAAYNITISYTYKSVAYTAVFTVSASKGEAVWQLKPSMSAIPFQRNADNTLTPASRAVGLSLLKIDGGSTATYTSVQTGLTVRYSTSSMPSSASAGTGWSSGNITVANSAENLFIALFNASGVLLDRETVPVVKDGEKGASSFTSHVFKRQNTQPSAPSGGSYSSPVPSGWSDGIPDGTAMVWMATRIFSSDGSSPQQSAWTTPRQMTDTADFDVEFSSVANADQYPPTGHPNTNTKWSNTASESTIWMATSECRNGVWSEWQVAKIKGEKGDKGDAGQSSFTSHVFKRQNSQPSAPSGGSYSSPVPSGWSDGVPDGTAMVWMSTRIFSSDGKVPQQSAWTTPRQMTDTADFDVEFSSVANADQYPPTGHPNTNTKWSNTASESTIWMATSECHNGVWSDWKVAKIKGEKGEPGAQGSYEQKQYAISEYATSASGTTWPEDCRADSYWSSTAPLPKKTKPFLWQRTRTYNPATGSYGTWSYARLTGQNGDPGSPGKTGLWYRYAGVWGVDVNPNVGVTNTDTVGYYVKYGSAFYMNIKESDANKTTPSESSDDWELMDSVFQYFISKAVFADTAYLGSFIINGDWLISQHGILYGNTGAAHVINNESSYGGYNVTNAFTVFDPSYPNSSKPSAYNFCPNVAIDGKTGAAYLNDLHAKGELNVGDEGTNRLEIAGNRKNGSIVESYIDGFNKSGSRILRLGFTTYSSGNASDAYLNLRNLSGKNQIYVYPSNINIENTVGSYTSVLTVGWLNDKIRISAPLSSWPTRDQVGVGEVFLGDDEILRVRRS